MARTSTFALADKAMKGRLLKLLTDGRDAGEGYEQIARDLSLKHGLDVSSSTVRRWCIRLGLDAVKAST